jgi:hypothetical protein
MKQRRRAGFRMTWSDAGAADRAERRRRAVAVRQAAVEAAASEQAEVTGWLTRKYLRYREDNPDVPPL